MKTFLSLAIALLFIVCANSLERKTYLKCGETLRVNEFIESTNGYYAILQSDCNFVIYRSRHFVLRNALWSSRTNRSGCVNPVLVNQLDGNVVIYNNGNSAIWSTGTNNGQQCYNLIMQDDGNLVLYTSDFKAVWASGTSA